MAFESVRGQNDKPLEISRTSERVGTWEQKHPDFGENTFPGLGFLL